MNAKTAKSVRQLAAAVGKTHPAVSDWIKHPDWDQARHPPWNVAKARTWAERTLAPDPAQTWRAEQTGASPGESGLDALRRNPLNAARLKLTVVRASKLELERAILAGEFIPRIDVQQAMVRRVFAAKAALQAIPRQVAGQMATLTDENQIEQVLEQAIDGALLELSQQRELPALPSTEITDE